MDMTGILNADKLITKARMAGLVVTIRTGQRLGIAGMRGWAEDVYTIDFRYPDLPRFAGTQMEAEYRESFYTAVFVRSIQPGARGRFLRLTHSRSAAVEYRRLALAAAQLDAMAADMAALKAPAPEAAATEPVAVPEQAEPGPQDPACTTSTRENTHRVTDASGRVLAVGDAVVWASGESEDTEIVSGTVTGVVTGFKESSHDEYTRSPLVTVQWQGVVRRSRSTTLVNVSEPKVTSSSAALLTAPDKKPEPRTFTPSVTSVIAVLKRAGFQHSRYVDSQSRYRPYGFRVRQIGREGEVLVTHEEGTAAFLERMAAGGWTDAADVPGDPEEPSMAAAYAMVLRERYTVRMSETSVYCSPGNRVLAPKTTS